jgi:hypothetical protein
VKLAHDDPQFADLVRLPIAGSAVAFTVGARRARRREAFESLRNYFLFDLQQSGRCCVPSASAQEAT